MNYKKILRISFVGLMLAIMPHQQTRADAVDVTAALAGCGFLLAILHESLQPSNIEKLQKHTKRLQVFYEPSFNLIDKYKNDQEALQKDMHLHIISTSSTVCPAENYQCRLKKISNDRNKL